MRVLLCCALLGVAALTASACSGVCVNGCETSLGPVVTHVTTDASGDPVVTRCQVDAKGHKLTSRDCKDETIVAGTPAP